MVMDIERELAISAWYAAGILLSDTEELGLFFDVYIRPILGGETYPF